MDWICIESLSLDAVIGVYDWEQETRQMLTFDVELGTDIRPAAASDDLGDTLNYFAVAEEVKGFVRSQRPALLETLLEQLAQKLLAHKGVQVVRLSVLKHGCIPGAKGARLIIERSHA
ncbi:dihydroneopterin aldolase [Salinibius halmophilus]|uniref:dihydroneopterin aldolase n=1 Tax=Salinibius halmophilus TaxID=1853216 RepID=UPI000E66939F|nr:dihydroneopterin aldolase [Salinibius halmophilus]